MLAVKLGGNGDVGKGSAASLDGTGCCVTLAKSILSAIAGYQLLTN